MNKLESPLNEIGGFNSAALDLRQDARAMVTQRETIIAQAKELGITRKRASEMLARVKVSIDMPEGKEAPAGESEAA